MKVETFVPEVVRTKDRDKPWVDRLRGSVLFADISGFTPMSETLSTLGAEGAEILTDILNRYFARMIGILNAHGGQVMKFGGDAILCFFPEAEFTAEAQRTQSGTQKGIKSKERASSIQHPASSIQHPASAALAAAQKMQQSMHRFTRIKTPVKTFALQMKIGVAEGEVLLAGVGDPSVRCDYVFAGKPVDLSSEAEHHAKAGEIVLAAQKPPAFLDDIEELDSLRPGLVPPASGGQAGPQSFIRNPKSVNISPYLIEEVHGMVKAGHHRNVGALQPVVPVFLEFSGFSYSAHSFDLQRFHKFFSLAMRITHQYEGRLNRISMGDKGSTMLILFGAPKEIEKKEDLACRWALEVRQQARKEFPEVRFRIGMTSGRVFSGIVGGSNRFEYTVMGDVVNLAARLMQGAKQNQICCSRDLQTKSKKSCRFEALGLRTIKGKAQSVPVFALKDLRKAQFRTDKQAFIGRTAEITAIADHLKSARSGSPRMVLVEGDAGVGKSFLANRILSPARIDRWSIVTCRSEASGHGRSYAPWHQVFDSLFFHRKKPNVDVIRALLQSADETFVKYLPWHLEYFGLRISDCGMEEDAGYRMQDAGYRIQDEEAKERLGYDEESRKNLLHHQLSVLLLRKFGSNPTLFFLDDLHWFDSLSLDLLLAFLNHLKDQPVLLLATTRPNWQKDKFVDRSTCHYFQLKEMDRGDVKEMAAKLLGADVRDALVDFLYERTQGNPFFTRQLFDYLKANDLLQSRMGVWTISRNAAVKGGLSGEEVIIAQVEHLKVEEQIHLRTAACIGPTFHFPVFEKAMGNSFGPNTFASLCSRGYFQEIGAGRFSFPHALVQETLYHAMPKRLRKKSHREIAFALESIFADNPAPHYPALATHFYEAGVRSKAIDYCIAAGEALHEKLSFPEAVHYLTNAYGLVAKGTDERKWSIGSKLAESLNRAGKARDGLRLSKQLRATARKASNMSAFYDACLIQFECMHRLSDYSFIKDAQRLLSRKGPLLPEARLQCLIGIGYYFEGRYDLASAHLNHALAVAQGKDFRKHVPLCYSMLAGVAKQQRNYNAALSHLDSSSKMAKSMGDQYQLIKSDISRSAVLIEAGRISEARTLLTQLLGEGESAGDCCFVGLTLANLGTLEINANNWTSATNYLKEAMTTLAAVGMSNECAKATMDLGIVFFYQDELAEAYEYYLKAATTFEKIRETVHFPWACYNIAEVMMKMSKIEDALLWANKGMRAFSAENDPELARLFPELLQSIKSASAVERMKDEG